jgi:hypothetical protein
MPLHALEILYKEAGSVLLPNTCSTALETIGENLSADQEEKVVWAVGTMTAGGLETVRRSPSCRKNLSNATINVEHNRDFELFPGHDAQS